MSDKEQGKPIEFDLFKGLLVLTIVLLVIAGLSVVDYSTMLDMDTIREDLHKPLEWKNWHYTLLVLLIYINGR